MPNPSDPVGLTRRAFEKLQQLWREFQALDARLARAEQGIAGTAHKARPIAFANTRDGGSYPANLESPGYLVYDIEFVSRTFAETVGEATPTDQVWTARFRRAMTLRKTKGFPVGTLCAVFRIGSRLYLEPVDGACDFIPPRWSDIPEWAAGTNQYLRHRASDDCVEWIAPSDQECPEEE